jgi:hypothetical protein
MAEEPDERELERVREIVNDVRQGGPIAGKRLRELFVCGYDVVGVLLAAWGEGPHIEETMKGLWTDFGKFTRRCALWGRAIDDHRWGEPDSIGDLALRIKAVRELEQNHPAWRDVYRNLGPKGPDTVELFDQMVLDYPNWPALWVGPEQNLPGRVREVKRRLESDVEDGPEQREGDEGERLHRPSRHSLTLAAALEERMSKARHEGDHAFFERFTEAVKDSLLDFESIVRKRIRPRMVNLVLASWRNLGGLDFSCPPPTKPAIKADVEEYYKKAGELPLRGDRTWQRTWEDPFISALFRG